jgi:hypothetical protein
MAKDYNFMACDPLHAAPTYSPHRPSFANSYGGHHPSPAA